MGNLWSLERETLLRKFHAEGLSFGQIAKRIIGTTRNGCIGKAQRLGLPPRGQAYLPSKPRKPRFRHASLVKRLNQIRGGDPSHCDARGEGVSTPPVEALPAPPSDWLTFEQLDSFLARGLPAKCRWPQGKGADMRFCGAPRAEHSQAYCAQHHRRAYYTPVKRRHRGGLPLQHKIAASKA